MNNVRSLVWRLRSLFVRDRFKSDLNSEIEAHLEMAVAEHAARGLTEADARRAALRDFGGVTRTKEMYRDVRGIPSLDALIRSTRRAVRSLRRTPAFTAIAVTTLAIGIGASTALFSVVYAVLLNPFPFANADRLVNVTLADKMNSRPMALSARQWSELRKSPVLSEALLTDNWFMTLTGEGLPRSVQTQYFSANALVAYGMRPLLGRIFTEADGPFGQEPEHVVVLTYRFWQKQFGGRPEAIGRHLQLNRESYEVIGILPQDLYVSGPEIIVPIYLRSDPSFAWTAQAVLKPGIDSPQAEAGLLPLIQQFSRDAPDRFPREFQVQVRNLVEIRRAAPFVPTLGVVGAAATLLLILACANVSTLMLARGAAREHEFAISAAIGASRKAMIGQLLVESLLLAVVGAGLGVMAASWAVPALLAFLPPNAFPAVPPDVQVSAPALWFGAAIAMLSSVISGVAPALSFSRPHISTLFGASATRTIGSRQRNRLRQALLAIQVAVTVVLLAGTGAAIRALIGLYQTPLGYDPHHLVSARLSFPDGSHAEWGERAAFYERLRDEIQRLPQVDLVASMNGGNLPPRIGGPTRVEVPGKETGALRPFVQQVGADFFAALRIPLLQGRGWTAGENSRAAGVAVVNEALAREVWPAGDAVGARIGVPELQRSSSQFVLAAPGANGWFEIVGIAGDTPNNGLHEPVEPTLYVPYTGMLGDSLTLVARTTRDPRQMERSIREAVHAVDPNQPVNEVRTAEEVLEAGGWAREQFVTMLLSGFGLFALILAAIGLYSVVSYSVSRRVKEFGIRRALGAGRAHVARMAVGGSMTAVGVGLVVGLGLSLAFHELVARWTIGRIADPIVLLGISLVLAAVGTIAAMIPTVKALSIHPASALRID